LYEILEIESSATETEIKKAYRKLALRYHPDKVSEDERESAEVKFKEITHAYEILSDETKRGEYDMYGSTDGVGGSYNDYSFHGNPFDNFYGNSKEYGADDFYNFFQGMNGGGHYERSNAKPRTEDAEINVDVTLEDLFKGKTIRTTSTRNIICKLCKGTGAKPSAVSKTCTACEGAGKIHKIQRLGPGMVTQKLVECTTCKGSGKIYRPKDKCKKCQGERVVEETKILEFEIKKGSKSGGTIVLKGESDECLGKETGDVRLTFTCKDHPVFERKGDDLYSKFKIPLADALCGFSKVVVKHLDGRSVRVTTPKGKVIRPGDFIKIKQEGMPVCSDNKSWFSSGSKRGDLYIEIDIEFPQDNWYLEKNDIFTMKNLLPNTLRNKADLKKQEVDQESSPEENIDEFTDFVISTRNALPNYDKETPQEQDHYDHHQNGYGAAQPECTQQ
jgi:DnaJ family protein A protein 2